MHWLVRKKRLIAIGLVIAAATLVALALLLRWYQVTIRRLTGNSRLSMIHIALMQYEGDHGSFPPAYTTDQHGKPMHSWRTILLPYFGDKELYDQIDFNAPWNSDKNRQLAAREPILYRCPDDTGPDSKLTGYVVLCDPNSLWPGSAPGKFTTGASNLDRILLLEMRHSDIEWMEPRDLTVKEALDAIQPKSSTGIGHPSVVAYMTVGAEIRTLDNEDDRKLFRERLRNSGDSIHNS
jgi:hypothetical protein